MTCRRLVNSLVFVVVLLLSVKLTYQSVQEARDDLVEYGMVNCSSPCQQFDNSSMCCPVGYYCDEYFMRCVACQSHCINCSSSDNCVQCDNGFVPKAGVCQGVCPPAHYYSPYSTKCFACPLNCVNCTGLNQCGMCSENYTLLNTSSRQVCVLPCNNGSFYNQSSDFCEACSDHCNYCISSLWCLECQEDFIIDDNVCALAMQSTATRSVQPTATRSVQPTATRSVLPTATPTISMQSTSVAVKSTNLPTKTILSTVATPTKVVQPTATPSEDHKVLIIIAGAGGGAGVLVLLLVIFLMVVVCYKKKKRLVDYRPMLQFDDDDDDDYGNHDND
ncbi:proprotein convertase subtilisin/kexin type 5-like isoform X2 [Dysidea avara]|uniref:proprotein convertase subtilisin/kexin type 5-like isoform X2 n=1 Tax=Dysidea avara TaxID=196820 RepID=UPI003330B767